jgi:hypothetical protein
MKPILKTGKLYQFAKSGNVLDACFYDAEFGVEFVKYINNKDCLMYLGSKKIGKWNIEVYIFLVNEHIGCISEYVLGYLNRIN